MSNERIFNAIILNDYIGKPYAQWVKEQKKTIETRMKHFKYRGDLVICCGNKSLTQNAGRALCIVDLYDARPMTQEDETAAMIETAPGRVAHMLRNWRYFSYDFLFSKQYVSGPYQGIFKISIPKNIQIVASKDIGNQ